MTTGDNKQLLQHIFAELSQGNSRPMLEALADDVRWRVMGTTPWSRTYDGKATVLRDLLGELRAHLAGRYAADALRFVAEGDLVVVEARGRATSTKGTPYNNEYCFIYRLGDDGRIREVTEYLDTELLVAALGD